MLGNSYTKYDAWFVYGVKVWLSTYELLPAKQRELNRLH